MLWRCSEQLDADVEKDKMEGKRWRHDKSIYKMLKLNNCLIVISVC